jgi:hypothetical protein
LTLALEEIDGIGEQGHRADGPRHAELDEEIPDVERRDDDDGSAQGILGWHAALC